MNNPIPHIDVKVEYDGETVSQQCAHFIDAITFLCGCEQAIRKKRKMQEPIDVQTSAFQKNNLDKLLELNKKINDNKE